MRISTRSAEWSPGPSAGETTITYLDLENGTVREDGTFEVGGIVGKVLFNAGAQPWSLKSVTLDGKDITTTGIDAATLEGDARIVIVLTDQATNVTGTAQDARRQPVSNYVVVLLPQRTIAGMGATRFTRLLRSDDNGTFRVRALPTGDYVAAAVEALDVRARMGSGDSEGCSLSRPALHAHRRADTRADSGAAAMSRTAAMICAIVLAAPLVSAQVATPQPQAPRLPPRDAAGLTPPASGTGRIRGRVLQAGTGTPIRRAQVTLTGEQSVQRLVTTDGNGRYEFSDLPAGRFTISAAKGGYLTLQYGQRRPFEPGRPVTLTDAQILGQVDLTLPRAGVISGRVIDRFGEPAVGADIVVERYQYSSDGQRRLTRAPGMPRLRMTSASSACSA